MLLFRANYAKNDFTSKQLILQMHFCKRIDCIDVVGELDQTTNDEGPWTYIHTQYFNHQSHVMG